MRYASLLLVPLALSAQQTASDQKLNELLITEVHQLRLAIDRAALLNAQAQLAVSQSQIQEASFVRLDAQYNEVRSSHLAASTRRNLLADKVKDLEQKRATENTAVMSATQIQLEQAKHDLEAATVTEQEWSARESELASPLNQARSKVAEARSRLTELEQAVDRAIRQLPNQP